jgi:hypothetical protein
MNGPKPAFEKDPVPEVTGTKAVETNAPPQRSEPAKKLTPEEQMALYEKDLKENDWGHQPC